MKKPILYTETPIFSQDDYDVFVGTMEEDKLPIYVVINRNTNVVEFTSEVTLGYLSWLDSIAKATADRNVQQSAVQEEFKFSFNN